MPGLDHVRLHFIMWTRILYISNSGRYTCHPHSGGHGVVDYITGSPSSIPLIFDFHVSPTTLSDHSFLSLDIGHLPPPQPSPHPKLTRAPKYTHSPLYNRSTRSL
ncbi:hypothetical protein O6H91_02G046300 [Diphasiastrum complanatum]|uniref:Uncharacterized protein n=1 Tax=Diphasiastrum complanatum TaxID=34168 RepID=A0ACC2EF31_DIPCM|nr:hypothetical protein O6H91_02G046300 [Diphasiastrum complanatum]